MNRPDDLFVLKWLVQRKLVSEEDMKRTIVEASRRQTPIRQLLLGGMITSKQWEEMLNHLYHWPQGPYAPVRIERENQFLAGQLQGKSNLPPNVLPKLLQHCKQAVPNRILPLWRELVNRQILPLPELYQHLSVRSKVLLVSQSHQYSIEVSPYLPWRQYPCIFSGQFLAPLARSTPTSGTTRVPGEPPKKAFEEEGDETEDLRSTRTIVEGEVVGKSAPSTRLAIEGTIGRYQVVEKLGEGGMGAVYKVKDPELDRVVALKVITLDSDNESYVNRFKREVKTVASFNHPNLIPVYEIGEWNRSHYYTMSMVSGINLREKVEEKGKVNFRRTLKIMIEVCGAVKYAHERGIVHRDIKPENIMLSTGGKPYLMDFGLARSVEDQNTRITQTGMVLGSPEFMSPEQAQGEKDVDFASDIYSLGATMYYMISGKTPFTGDGLLDLLYKVVEDDPIPLRTHAPSIPKSLEVVIHKCLAKDREKRYRDVSTLEDDLRSVLHGSSIFASLPGFRKKLSQWVSPRTQSTVNVTLLVAVMVLVGLWAFREKPVRVSGQTKGESQKEIEKVLSTLEGKEKGQDQEALAAKYICNLKGVSLSRLVGLLASPHPSQRNVAIICLEKLGDNQSQIDGKKLGEHLKDRLADLMKEGLDESQKGEVELLVWSLGRLAYGPAKVLVLKIRLHWRGDRKFIEKTRGPYDWIPSVDVDPKVLAREYCLVAGKLRESGEPKKALPLLNQALKKFQDYGPAYLEMGRCRLALGKPDLSIKAAEKALAIDQNDGEAHLLMGKSYLQTEKYNLSEKYKLARESFEKAAKIKGVEGPAQLALGKIAFRDKKYKPAESYFSQAIENKTSLVESLFYRGRARNKLDLHKKALEDYRAVQKWGRDTAELHFHIAENYLDMGEYSSALEEYNLAIEKDEKMGDAHIGRGRIQHLFKKHRRALVDLNRGLKLSPKSAIGYYTRGRVHYKLKDFVNAELDALKALTLIPKWSEANKLLESAQYFTLRQRMREMWGADRLPKQIYTPKSEELKAKFIRAARLILSRKPNEANELLNEVLAEDPKYVDAYLYRGFCRIRRGEVKEARADYKKALELAPEEPLSYLYKSTGMRMLRDWKEYRKDLLTYLELRKKQQ